MYMNALFLHSSPTFPPGKAVLTHLLALSPGSEKGDIREDWHSHGGSGLDTGPKGQRGRVGRWKSTISHQKEQHEQSTELGRGPSVQETVRSLGCWKRVIGSWTGWEGPSSEGQSVLASQRSPDLTEQAAGSHLSLCRRGVMRRAQ